MADMTNFAEEYTRITSIGNSKLIAKELKEKSLEFKEEYNRLRRKTRNDKYREPVKDKINEKRREIYKKKKEENQRPIVATIPDVKIEDVNTEITRDTSVKKRDVNDLSENTKKSYLAIVKKLYKKYTGKQLLPVDHLYRYLEGDKNYNTSMIFKHHSYIIDVVGDIFVNYQKDIPQLYSVFSKFRGKQIPKIAEALYPFMKSVNKNYEENRGKNVVVNEEEVNKISFERDDVIKNMEKLDYDNEKMLYALTFLLPTRRLYDYRYLKIAKSIDDTKNKEYNWYYDNNIYINITKNKKESVIPITDPYLKDLFNNIDIDEHFGAFVFKKFLKPHEINRMFNKIMMKIYDCKFNLMDIRHLYCTNKVKNMNNINELKNDAEQIGHSLTEHIAYVIPTTNNS